MAEKKRKTWLWILGWILCFPIPLTILMLRNKKLSNGVRYGVIAAAWILLLGIGVFAKPSKKSETPVEKPAAQEEVADKAEEDSTEKPAEKSEDESKEASKEAEEKNAVGMVYMLSGDDLGEYGRAIVLNQDTDMPVEKHLYKIPAGKYRVKTTNQKFSAFYVAKDEVGIEEGNDTYPETLQPVTEEFVLTAGNNDLNGHAIKEVTVEIAEDESIVLPGDVDNIIVEELLD